MSINNVTDVQTHVYIHHSEPLANAIGNYSISYIHGIFIDKYISFESSYHGYARDVLKEMVALSASLHVCIAKIVQYLYNKRSHSEVHENRNHSRACDVMSSMDMATIVVLQIEY